MLSIQNRKNRAAYHPNCLACHFSIDWFRPNLIFGFSAVNGAIFMKTARTVADGIRGTNDICVPCFLIRGHLLRVLWNLNGWIQQKIRTYPTCTILPLYTISGTWNSFKNKELEKMASHKDSGFIIILLSFHPAIKSWFSILNLTTIIQ
jgi:hypothetical protein